MKTIFLIVGRSAVGKTSIAKAICNKLNLNLVKSYTTRPKRDNEDNNGDHYFITPEEVENYSNKAAYTVINDVEYFTTFEILDNADVYVIDPNGIDDLKRRCGDRYRFVEIYIRVPYSVAKERARNRTDSMQLFDARRNSEENQFNLYEARHTFHYHLLNDGTFEEAVNKVSLWITKELEHEY